MTSRPTGGPDTPRRPWVQMLALTISLSAIPPSALHAQAAALVQPSPLITAPIDESRRIVLSGNTRPEANRLNDRGRVADATPLAHMQLLLRRSADREAALQRYIAQLHDRASANYHHWLSAAEFARRFAPAAADGAIVADWLRRHGLVVETVYPNGMVIDFSGTAGAVHAAFHTEIHALTVGGAHHIANMSDPEIPAALASAVVGVVSLHDFRPRPAVRPRAAYTPAPPATGLLLAPADLAVIYDLNPAWSEGYTGRNQTIAVIEDTNVYSAADWTAFRTAFGLSGYTSGSFTQSHPAPPTGTNNCANPGVLDGDYSFEAILDAEWASAAAPNAAIVLASCADTGTTFGGLIALENLINESASPPAIISISYGECEAANGASANAAYASTYEQAVTEGVSIFVAAGDQGAAGCDVLAAGPAGNATHGIGVNAFASTAYNVAVGGTDFNDYRTGTTGTYWSGTNGAGYGSALSYVPEIPWNSSCAGGLLAAFEGYAAAYGSGGYCNSGNGSPPYLQVEAGSGGPSACATGAPATTGVVGGTCAGTPKPSWQTGVAGIPNDHVRDLPDVSLFASNGLWSHYYVVCWSNTSQGGKACTGAPSAWSGGGGTSFSAPILAGIQALIDQSTGARAGNPNTVYYPLAASQAAAGLACNSSLGNAVGGGCVFHDVTQGDIDVPCTGSNDCFLPSGAYGALSTSDASFQPAYGAATGWDFATGIGSVNAYNLLRFWSASDLALSGGGTATATGLVSYVLTLANRGPQAATGVTVSATLPAGAALVANGSSSGCLQSGQMLTCSLAALAVGAGTSVTILVQPNAAAESFAVTFTAASTAANLDPAAASDPVALTLPPALGATDAPAPPWMMIGIGASLILVARRRLAARDRDHGPPS